MQVVLGRAARSGRFDKVHEGTKEELREVEHEQSNAELLVRVIEMYPMTLINCVNP